MAHVIGFDDGEILDIDEPIGQYRYVARFLRENAADSTVFSCLGKLCPKETTIRRAGLQDTENAWGDCENCGEIITRNAKYCSGCGRRVAGR